MNDVKNARATLDRLRAGWVPRAMKQENDFIDPEPEPEPAPKILSGRRFGFDAAPEPKPVYDKIEQPVYRSSEQIYREFVEMAKSDPIYLERLAHAFDYQAPFRKAEPLRPMPFATATTIEIAIADRGPPKKTKRERIERQSLRFSATIQVCTSAQTQISKAGWSGLVDFRSPKRARLDADRFLRQKSITQAYRDFIEEACIAAQNNDYMIGFLKSKTNDSGTPFTDRQIIFADRSGLENHKLDQAILMMQDQKGTAVILLPRFDEKTSTGKPLNKFVLQCRAIRQNLDGKQDWATGEFELKRG
ncbi:hypothetical protein [Flavisphingomonas formosensis]|uniref:hypothetical protein n=1 Tax=Flavisphingomonas formosensis TaxID=861534 RepID=UPI0012FA9D91|nr:hypothetical protein [Sphingomonas formosensis]